MSTKTLKEKQLWYYHLLVDYENLSGQRKHLIKLKIQLYRALILPITTYASEIWALTAANENKLLVFKMQCQRSMLGTSTLKKIRNIEIRRTTVAEKTIVDIIPEERLKSFFHLCRRPINSWIYQAYEQDFPNSRPTGRPPKRCIVLVKKDMGLPILTAKRNTYKRNWWRQNCLRRARGQHDLCN